MDDALLRFEFEVVLVDECGNVMGRRTGQADYFAVDLDVAELEMVRIPGGSFMMGALASEPGVRENELPQHEVHVASFFIGKFPLTQAQWYAVMKTLPAIDDRYRGECLPVVNVWWEQAEEYCQRLSDLTGREFRLPTEAEWEYACRAGTTTPFHFGPTITADLANFNAAPGYGDAPGGEYRQRLTPVGYFQTANQFGLYDLHGNVWEWCADVWHDDYTCAPVDGSAWVAGGDQGYRVQRGGSWRDSAVRCRSAFRVGDIAHNSDHIVGLRVCAVNNGGPA